MSSPPILDHNSNIYLTVTTSASPYGLPNAHPSLIYVGPVGSLPDVHILSVPKSAWTSNQSEILSRLSGMEGVANVEVQGAPRARVKRGDEL
ncbi:hypothetical protein EUX98_g2300 [Antrodiella citrinella]|uniref:Uncharacterized protein n=1 Tax=Antrodiella citrinella TaxID=2447956 RepID=A0A4S4MZA5_9APHY|nr:hypothetical protein EUX98_g2300 [Antrodiella citrinella]